MTEQRQESEPKYANFIYTGRDLKTQGTGIKGDWKLFVLKMKIDLNAKHPLNFNCFDSISDKSIQLNDLVEGDVYNLGWKESTYQHEQHGQQMSRTVFYISKPKNGDDSLGFKDESQSQPQHEPTQQQGTNRGGGVVAVDMNTVPTDQQLDDFLMAYKKICKVNNVTMTPEGFVKAYLKTKFRDSKLILALEQRYAQERNVYVKDEEVVM